MPFKVAVIGAGTMAREHIIAFNAIPDVEVVGLCSRTRAKAQALAASLGVPFVSESVDRLFRETRANLVVVAVPELAANAVAKACFVHDWAVLLEKPAGYDLADAEDIAVAAHERHRLVMVALNRRFYSATLAAKHDLDSNSGDRRFIHVQDQQNFGEARRHNHPEAVVQCLMYANSIHNIDLLMYFGRGEVTKVTPIMPWNAGETEVVLAHIEFDSGDSGLYEGIWKGPGPWACRISTPRRLWTMQPLEQASYQNAGERIQHAVTIAECDKRFKPGCFLQAQAAVRKARGEPSDICDLADSLRSMRLIHRIFGV